MPAPSRGHFGAYQQLRGSRYVSHTCCLLLYCCWLGSRRVPPKMCWSPHLTVDISSSHLSALAESWHWLPIDLLESRELFKYSDTAAGCPPHPIPQIIPLAAHHPHLLWYKKGKCLLQSQERRWANGTVDRQQLHILCACDISVKDQCLNGVGKYDRVHSLSTPWPPRINYIMRTQALLFLQGTGHGWFLI